VLNAILQQMGGLLTRRGLGLPPGLGREEASVLDSDEMVNNAKLPRKCVGS
jgi:hypothetical protein